MPRGEHAPPAPGVVNVRLQGDGDSTGALVRLLREHAEILTGPDRLLRRARAPACPRAPGCGR